MGQIVNGMTARPRENYKHLKSAFTKLQKLNYKVCAVWRNEMSIGKAICTEDKKHGIIQIFSEGSRDNFSTLNTIVVFLVEHKDGLLDIVSEAAKGVRKTTNKKQQQMLFSINKMLEQSKFRIEILGGTAVSAERNGKTNRLSIATISGYEQHPDKSAISLDHCNNKTIQYDKEDALRNALISVIGEGPALHKLLSGLVDYLPRETSAEFDKAFATEWPFYGKESIPLLIHSLAVTQEETPKMKTSEMQNSKRNAVAGVHKAKNISTKPSEVSGATMDEERKPTTLREKSGAPVKYKQEIRQPLDIGNKITTNKKQKALPPIPQEDIVGHLNAELDKSNKLCKQYDAELKETNEKLIALEKKNQALAREKTEHEKTIQDFNTNREAEKQHFLGEAEKIRKYYEGEVDKLTEQLSITNIQYNEESRKTKDLTGRLAAEMNIKISANESSLENISIKCRPMKIAEDYGMFVSGPWLDAKQVLDDEKIPEEDASKFLCSIIQISSKQAQAMFGERILSPLAMLQHNVRQPLRNQQRKNESGTKDITSSNDNPLSSLDSIIGDQLRRDAETVDIKPLCEEIVKAIRKDFEKSEKTLKLKIILASKAVQHYIETSARLAWKMVIQRPPMTYETPDVGKEFRGENVHPLAWGSQPKGAKSSGNIKYYQYPTLLHGEKVMVLGKVFVA